MNSENTSFCNKIIPCISAAINIIIVKNKMIYFYAFSLWKHLSLMLSYTTLDLKKIRYVIYLQQLNIM